MHRSVSVMDLEVSRKRSHSTSQEPSSKLSKKSSKKRSKKCSKDKSRKSKSHKKRKRRYSSSSSGSSDSSDSSSSSSSSSSDSSTERKRKEKKKKKKNKQKSSSKDEKSKGKVIATPVKKKSSVTKVATDDGPDVGPSINLQSSKMRAPMTKEEYEKQQNTLRWVDDPETGRKRLIRGSGEIVESIVSKERHKEINKQATAGDGQFFKNQSLAKAKSSYQ